LDNVIHQDFFPETITMKRVKKTRSPFYLLRILGLSLLMVFITGAGSSIISSIVSQEDQMPIIAPLNEEFLQFQKDPTLAIVSRYSDEGYPLGLLPSPHDVSYFKNQLEARIAGLLSSYDLREKNKLTNVKNQGNCGSCWAFATYGSLESFLLLAENWDFSEQNLIDRHGFDYGPCVGGNIYMSAAYLTRWSGPIKEEDDPYIYAADTFPVKKHVQELILIPPKSDYLANDLLKQAVMSYGAVYTTMYWKSPCYNSTYKTYYNTSFKEGSHAVAIVGWDDNFDKSKFNTPPPGNGAFIVKNSWGTDWGESGYFYVSYYDEFFGRRDFNAVVKAETSTNYEIIYQYDPLGWVSSLGYGADTAWFANIFTATSSIPLTAVSFYAAASQNSYEIFIYRDVAADQPRSGALTETKTGQLDSPGYFTVQLDRTVDLKLNQRFSVAIKLKTTGYNYPIPFEWCLTNYSSRATANAGESFVSSNGDTWSDLHTSWGGRYANSNVCLKAFAGYPPLYPPANFALQRLENDFVFFKEYINRLSWEANPKNRTKIITHKLYRKTKGAADKTFQLIAELGASGFSYDDRGLKKSGLYSYWVTVVDEFGRESEPASINNVEIAIRSTRGGVENKK